VDNMKYPWTLNYKELCPKKDSCSGFITFSTKRGSGVSYCHERMCPEIWDVLKNCPCADHLECRGTQWINGKEVCNLKEGIFNEDTKHQEKRVGYVYVK